MARRFWLSTLSDFFQADVSREVQTPHERYLELARKCMEHAQRMTSLSVSTSLHFNHRQCEYLANKLGVAVQSALEYALKHPPEVRADSVEIVKLLCRCAKEVDTFVESFRQDNWIQAAVVLSNVSEHVSSLSADLNFFTLLFRNSTSKLTTWRELADLDVLNSESIKEHVLRDQRALLSRLEAVNYPLNTSSVDHRELAKCLSRRLSQHLSGVVQSKVWELDYFSLRPVRRLGNGSGCTVFKSIWLGTEVAEKRIYGADHPGFRNEVEILAGLAHPNIVPFLGYAIDESRCSIFMELMDGDLLFLMEERLRENPTYQFPFTTSEAVDMMLQTAEGVLYLHVNKVVHRDLKSQNILVKSRKGIDAEYIYAKVADFGLSKTKESSSSYSNLTANTGKTRWMAPELIPQGKDDSCSNRELRYPFKVDVYSFGMVCYEILTGKVPFSTISSLKEVKKMVMNGVRPELPDHCLYDLKILIHSCWESEASHRPSFVEICKRLRYMKYLLMRGSGITVAAHQSEFEAYANIVACAPYARQIESDASCRWLATAALRALDCNFAHMETIQGSRSMFRGNMGGGFVAVKNLEGILPISDLQEFEKKVLQLWKLDHENVLKMIGYRMEKNFKVAVFEYAPLGSLRSILHGEGEGSVRGSNFPVLTWTQRVKIAVGVARGLQYLHGQDPPVFCRSVRSSKILVFDDYVAKIHDFALLRHRRLFDIAWFVDTRPTPAPKSFWKLFVELGMLKLNIIGKTKLFRIARSGKGDIYDFGVVLLELLTGRRFQTAEELESIVPLLSEDNIRTILDPKIHFFPIKAASQMAACAGLCLDCDVVLRPEPGVLVRVFESLLQP